MLRIGDWSCWPTRICSHPAPGRSDDPGRVPDCELLLSRKIPRVLTFEERKAQKLF